MLYPDGRYFADEDGFGMKDNDIKPPAHFLVVRLGEFVLIRKFVEVVAVLLTGE